MKINKALRRLSVLISIVAFTSTISQAQQQTGAHAEAHPPQNGGKLPPHKDATSHPCPLMQEGGEKEGTVESTGDGHARHLAAINARGEKSMGFSQTQTTHHFILTVNGGFIQIETNDAGDMANRERIREHLASIARAFAEGDFGTPQNVHQQVPPGVPEMRRLRSAIEYKYEKLERGGRLSISTDDREALAAVHQFLRFQIKDHQTGDALEVRD